MEAADSLETAYDLHRAGQFAQAAVIYQRVLAANPDNFDALHNYGLLLSQSGDLPAALRMLERSVALQPRSAAFLSNLGTVYRSAGQLELSERTHLRALTLDPNRAESHYNYGNVLQDLDRIDDAILEFGKAVRLRPDYSLAILNLGKMFKDQARLEEAERCYRQVIAGPNETAAGIAYDNLLHLMTIQPASTRQKIYDESVLWAQRFADPLLDVRRHESRADYERRIRIGYVSSCLFEHSIGLMIEPILANHDRKRFEIFAYADLAAPDATSARLATYFDHWVLTTGMNDSAVAEQARHDGIDILVDLTSHTAGSRLGVFARKPAPVQFSYLGYPGTTGVRAIDYIVSDPILDPVERGDAGYVERVVRLPNAYWCDRDRPAHPEPGPLPADRNGFVTFGSLNNFSKTTDAAMATWGHVLARVPSSKLHLVVRGGLENNKPIKAIVHRAGISIDRVVVHDRVPRERYMALYHDLDISLDPFPYNGHTTTLDSLWMGVPVVTLEGDFPAARGGLSILSAVGLQQFVATSPQQYVKLAAHWATHLDELRHLRAQLRPRLQSSPLRQPKQFTAHLEQLYLDAWRPSCTK